MQRGYLVIANDVAADAEDEFNRWYQNEHLPERLGVPGFNNVRRYVAENATLQYFAIYETDDPDVLTSPAYRERLSAPTPWTQRMMPSFRNMHRTVMRADYRAMRGMGALLDLIVLDATVDATHLTFDRIAAALAEDAAFEGLLVLAQVGQASASGTTEGSLRGGPDAAMARAAVVQWSALPRHRPPEPHVAFERAGLYRGDTIGGRYRLMTARGRFDFA
ncbi:MAG TPA: hypothetical protein VFB54_00510 [Burkholderiales bacterium]|nr:hypothetical protein [Burkholderiales bacterium]